MGAVTVVYDTNVLVSGIAFGGKPWECLLLSFVGGVEMAASERTLTEFERVLSYDHLPFTGEEQQVLPELVRREATVVEPEVTVHEIDEDPDDDKFLECAVAADADYLVSRDDHVLDVGRFRGTDVVTANELLQQHGT